MQDARSRRVRMYVCVCVARVANATQYRLRKEWLKEEGVCALVARPLLSAIIITWEGVW